MRDRLFLSGKYFRHCSTCDEKKKRKMSDPYSLIHLLFSHNARFFHLSMRYTGCFSTLLALSSAIASGMDPGGEFSGVTTPTMDFRS